MRLVRKMFGRLSSTFDSQLLAALSSMVGGQLPEERGRGAIALRRLFLPGATVGVNQRLTQQIARLEQPIDGQPRVGLRRRAGHR